MPAAPFGVVDVKPVGDEENGRDMEGIFEVAFEVFDVPVGCEEKVENPVVELDRTDEGAVVDVGVLFEMSLLLESRDQGLLLRTKEEVMLEMSTPVLEV